MLIARARLAVRVGVIHEANTILRSHTLVALACAHTTIESSAAHSIAQQRELLPKFARSEHDVEEKVNARVDHDEEIGQIETNGRETTLLELHARIQDVDDFCNGGRKVADEKYGHHAE